VTNLTIEVTVGTDEQFSVIGSLTFFNPISPNSQTGTDNSGLTSQFPEMKP
jgi:hypothetical protein